MTDPYINRILKKTTTKEDLVYIANNFTKICESIKDVNDVFILMKEEQHLSHIIKNILREKYGVYPKEYTYVAYKKK